eukprot:5151219-Prymnesium_polylepis.1
MSSSARDPGRSPHWGFPITGSAGSMARRFLGFGIYIFDPRHVTTRLRTANTLGHMVHGLSCAVRRYSDATRPCGASGT